MIIAKLMGGLGNQMFQYAAARRLANANNAELKLDISFLESAQKGYIARVYELGSLNITAAIASSREVAEFTGRGKSHSENLLRFFLRSIGLNKQRATVYKELHFHFDPQVLHLPDDTYLEGYWQSEKYFKDIGEIIRKEFTVKYPLEGKNLELSEMLAGSDSVGIHIRRGDYVTDQKTRRVHGACGLDYYYTCVEEASKAIERPRFFIFSDEPAWVKENFSIPFSTTFVEHNPPDKGYEDLRLMGLCKHQIIANSSFSWWAAWLNRNPHKRIFAPKTWLQDRRHDTKDVIPDTWLKI